MIKRFLAVLILMVILMHSITVCADVVMGNDFLHNHENKTEMLDRRFYVNSPSGYIIPKEEPGSEKGVSTEMSYIQMPEDVFTFNNGEIIYIEQIYLCNGEYWGIMPVSHAYQPPGWFPMDELLMLYECQDFNEENKDAFYTYNGGYDKVVKAERLVLWQWPGCDREKRVIDAEWFDPASISALQAYKDKDGREWGYVLINYIEAWICLSDPENSKIPAFHPAPKPVKWSPDKVIEWTHTGTADNSGQQYSLSNITKVRTYKPNQTFIDVHENAWYKDAVAAAYEYDIIDGISSNSFAPDDELTFGEALTIAARIHAYYKYGKEQGVRLLSEYNSSRDHFAWWSGAARYCEDEGLIIAGEFADQLYYYSWCPLTRAEMVHAWANILHCKDITKQNIVVNVPDINANTPYRPDILLFYEAGIVGGVDARGSFNPNGNITRAEAATVFMNIVNINKRHSGKTYSYFNDPDLSNIEEVKK